MILLHARPVPSAAPRALGWSRVLLLGILSAGLLAVLVARWWTGTGYVPSPLGLPDAGQLTSIGLPAAQFVQEVAGVAVVGVLFVRCLSMPDSADPAAGHLLAVAARWAWLWVAATLSWLILTASELTGLPVVELPHHADLLLVVARTDRMVAEMVTLWVALAVALFAARLSTRASAIVALAAATAALLPSALTGHAGHHESPAVAVIALAVHVVASAVWVGGLLALIIHLRPFPERLRAALPLFSSVALLCLLAVGISGVLESVVTLQDWNALVTTERGRLILAKIVALGVLAAIGYLHRRRTLTPASTGQLRPLLRLAAGELLLMGAAVGVAVVLSTTG